MGDYWDDLATALRREIPEDDPFHPLSVLGAYEMMIREDYDQPTTLEVTVPRARAYLDGQLDRIAQDPDQDFALLATEVRRCRDHLEQVLHDSRRPELGAPCPECTVPGWSGPRLVKHYRNENDRGEEDLTGGSDWWACPAVEEHWWTEADYRLRVAGDYLQVADRLTANQMHEAHGIAPATLRQWASRGHVARRGLNHAGQLTYDVQQAIARRDQATTEETETA